MSETEFHIREAESAKHDAQFILAAFDSSLPHLNATGSAGQWGSDPLSANASLAEAITSAVDEAETYRRTREGKFVETLVAEVDAEGEFEHVENGERMRVAGVVVRDAWWPWYISKMENLAGRIKDEKSWAYVHVLISDFRAGEWRKGGGAALVKEVRERAKARGVERMFVDCWAGNERRLVGFYETQGFVWVDDFVGERPHKKDLGVFEGAFLKMDL